MATELAELTEVSLRKEPAELAAMAGLTELTELTLPLPHTQAVIQVTEMGAGDGDGRADDWRQRRRS